jgi:hypothetical protein
LVGSSGPVVWLVVVWLVMEALLRHGPITALEHLDSSVGRSNGTGIIRCG